MIKLGLADLPICGSRDSLIAYRGALVFLIFYKRKNILPTWNANPRGYCPTVIVQRM